MKLTGKKILLRFPTIDEVVSMKKYAVDRAAAASIPEGGAVLVRVEWLTAQTFARRVGVENLLLDLLGTGTLLYLSYTEDPGPVLVEGAWNGGPVPEPSPAGGLRTVYDRPIFEVNVPLDAPAGSTAS